MDIKYLIMDLLRCKNINEFLTKRFLSDFYKFNNSTFQTIGTENANYYINEFLFLVQQAINEYNYNDLRDSDIVLDIGASVGGFSLEVHKKVKHVFAVEPLFYNELNKNIKLNNTQKVTVIKNAIGETGTKQLIEFIGRQETTECKSLSDLIQICGGHVDVLKMDCEGGEWFISADEIKDIRRIEMELHLFNGENVKDFFKILNVAKFNYNISHISNKTLIIHACKS